MKRNEEDKEHAELTWVELTEAGMNAFSHGNFEASAQQWTAASEIAMRFDEADPRRAASLNNLAVGYRLQTEAGDAKRYYRLALRAWDDATQWVDNMRISARARSSLFHLKLESKHREHYDQAFIDKYQKLLGAGRAATLNNMGELAHSSGLILEAARLYRQALAMRRDNLRDDTGLAIIRGNLAGVNDTAREALMTTEAASFRERAERNRWIIDRPPVFTDEGRLMAAILLTELISAPRLTPRLDEHPASLP